MLIHEDGKEASWGYSHLPATIPLTWTQARAACEAVPGSMLARGEYGGGRILLYKVS